MGYKFMWNVLRELNLIYNDLYQSQMAPKMSNGLSFKSFLAIMNEIEDKCAGNKWFNGTVGVDVPITIAAALVLGFALLGVIATVLYVMGRIAYVC